MERRVRAIRDEGAPELVWLLGTCPFHTVARAPGLRTSRTRIAFPSMRRAAAASTPITAPASGSPMSCWTWQNAARMCGTLAKLEAWVIAALGEFNVKGEVRRRVGVWVDRSQPGTPPRRTRSPIGLRLKRWAGISLNVESTSPTLRESRPAASRRKVSVSPASSIWVCR